MRPIVLVLKEHLCSSECELDDDDRHIVGSTTLIGQLDQTLNALLRHILLDDGTYFLIFNKFPEAMSTEHNAIILLD